MLNKVFSWLLGNDNAPSELSSNKSPKTGQAQPRIRVSTGQGGGQSSGQRRKLNVTSAPNAPQASAPSAKTTLKNEERPDEPADVFMAAGQGKSGEGVSASAAKPGPAAQPVEKDVEAEEQGRVSRLPSVIRPADDTDGFEKEQSLRASLKVAEPATAEDLVRLQNFDGEVLSGGAVAIPEQAKGICAYLSNGWFVVDTEHVLDPHVLTVRKTLTKERRVIKKMVMVERSVIRGLYERHRRRFGNRTSAQVITGVDTQEYQRLFLEIIENASSGRVSDIHFMVRQHETDLLFRKNGIMQKMYQREASWGHQICRTAFAMADASGPTYLVMEYQGARISNARTSFPNGVQSIRLQFNPLPNGGRYLVCRLLYESSGASTTSISGLQYAPVHERQIAQMRRQSYGINIISGPTGSGKSTTLVCILTELMNENPGENVITIEDPPEFVIARTAQLPVLSGSTAEQRKEGFTIAINGSLRSDPDKIMIGEIRDAASASLAYEAAMTGHGVYASLHANTAQGILTRLRDIKVEVYKVTDHKLMTGLIGQRLVRRLCPHCKMKWTDMNDNQLRCEGYNDHVIESTRRAMKDRLDNVFVKRIAGCDKCDGGIAGRLAVAETITPDEKYMTFIRRESYTEADTYWLEELEGLRMSEHALQKVFSGECAPADVMPVGDIALFDTDRADLVFGDMMAH